ncbi:hypothetical protein EWM60_02165 [Candidatus Erwinia dacicola]|nr:hypothetical protein [Candidatus Erwinia dacicola]
MLLLWVCFRKPPEGVGLTADLAAGSGVSEAGAAWLLAAQPAKATVNNKVCRTDSFMRHPFFTLSTVKLKTSRRILNGGDIFADGS